MKPDRTLTIKLHDRGMLNLIRDLLASRKAVQLDAWREGMTHAAVHISEHVALSKSILQERDRVEELE